MQVYRSLLGRMFIGRGSIRGMSETTLRGTDLRLTTVDLIQCTVCEYGLQKSSRFIDVIRLTFILIYQYKSSDHNRGEVKSEGRAAQKQRILALYSLGILNVPLFSNNHIAGTFRV